MSDPQPTPTVQLLKKLLKRQEALSKKFSELQAEREEQKQEIVRLKRKNEEDREDEEKKRERQTKAQRLSVKVPQPPYFEGNNKVNIDIWLFEVQQYLDLVQVPSEQRVAWAGTLLRESAATWWNSAVIEKKRKLGLAVPSSSIPISSTTGTSTSTTTTSSTSSTTAATTTSLEETKVQELFTWEEFIAALKQRYVSEDAAKAARAKLAILQQFKLTGIEAYNTEFQRQMALIHDMAVADQIEYYERGLLSEVRKDVVNSRPTNLMEAMSAAARSSAVALSTKTHAHVTASTSHSTGGGQSSQQHVEEEMNAIQSRSMTMRGNELMESPLFGSNLNYIGAPTSNSYRGGRGLSSGMRGGQGTGSFRSREESDRLMRENRCFYCKQEGHVARWCPRKRGGGYSRGRNFSGFRGNRFGGYNGPSQRGGSNYRARSW
jgi:hypothetical protein